MILIFICFIIFIFVLASNSQKESPKQKYYREYCELCREYQQEPEDWYEFWKDVKARQKRKRR